MPLYEYRCQKCDHSFKKIFLIVKHAPFICPNCNDNKEKELLNYVSFKSDIGIGIGTSYKHFSYFDNATL